MSKPETLDLTPGQDALLSWYDRQKRDLPWRRDRNPYYIWVSEIMLQQTQVATAKPYFETFIQAFPTIADLAAADIDQVLARWSGLGYYRRARLMHDAARRLTEDGKQLPRTAQELEELPGIGPYTAAAIASIAFEQHVAVLDGNVERVLCRLLAYDENAKTAPSRRLLAARALELVSAERPGDGNQALMELGATICRPKSPKCLLCPVSDLCRGKSEAERFPVPRKRRRPRAVHLSVALTLDSDRRVLMFRRAESSDLLAGMWELPHHVHGDTPPVDLPDAAKEVARQLAKTYGGSWSVAPSEAQVKHSITHRALTFHIHSARLEPPFDQVMQRRTEAAWVGRDDLDRHAMSSAVRKILKRGLGW